MSGSDVLVAPAVRRRPPAVPVDHVEEARLLALVVAGREAAARLAEPAATDGRPDLEAAVEAADEARSLLLAAHQAFVANVAYRYRHSGVPLADLIQEGNLGLMAALDRFDPEAGSRFSSFAWHWVRQTILAGIPRHRPFSLSPGVAREVYRVRKVRARLEAELGREASPSQVAQAAEVSANRVVQLESLNQAHSALTEMASATMVDALDDGDPARILGKRMALQAVRELVEALPARERFVIECRYGLGRDRAQRLSEVAETLGVTPSRAWQIERVALDKLRRLATTRELAAA